MNLHFFPHQSEKKNKQTNKQTKTHTHTHKKKKTHPNSIFLKYMRFDKVGSITLNDTLLYPLQILHSLPMDPPPKISNSCYESCCWVLQPEHMHIQIYSNKITVSTAEKLISVARHFLLWNSTNTRTNEPQIIPSSTMYVISQLSVRIVKSQMTKSWKTAAS